MRLPGQRPRPLADERPDPAAAEDLYLAMLRRRVGWPAGAAARLRAGETPSPVAWDGSEAPADAVEQPAPSEARSRPAGQAGWTLAQLEAIVAERERVDAEAARELSYYTFYLRNFVGPDGRLPDYFERLLEDVFGASV